jgi:hypothetical protein
MISSMQISVYRKETFQQLGAAKCTWHVSSFHTEELLTGLGRLLCSTGKAIDIPEP